MSRIRCVCPGAPDAPNPRSCPADATQEDFLCDHCRTVNCPSLSSNVLDYDPGLCIRLGCPEHSVPGARLVEVAF